MPTDVAGALVPHTLAAPLVGAATGPLAGTTFVLKDLFDIAGRKTGNGNPTVLAKAKPADRTASVLSELPLPSPHAIRLPPAHFPSLPVPHDPPSM